MRTYRCWIDAEPEVGDVITLSPEESRHLGTVRRASVGDPVLLLNGRGNQWSAEVIELSKKAVRVKVTGLDESLPRPLREVLLCCALTRTGAFEDLIERSVELGATAIRSVITERTVVNWDTRKAPAKLERWNRLAAESLKQCERLWLPGIEAPARLADLIHGLAVEGFLTIVLAERSSDAPPLVQILEAAPQQSIALLVGPEGGWSDGELALFAESNLQRASLGTDAVLRSETAALAALAMVMASNPQSN